MTKKTWMRTFADEINFLRAERGNISLRRIAKELQVPETELAEMMDSERYISFYVVSGIHHFFHEVGESKQFNFILYALAHQANDIFMRDKTFSHASEDKSQ